MGLPFCQHAECYDDHGDWQTCKYADPRFPENFDQPQWDADDWLPEDEEEEYPR